MHHMTKFSIISQVKKHHWLDNNITTIIHWLYNNITYSWDKEECENFLIIAYNLSQQSIINVKFSSGSDHLVHEECGSSITNVDQHVFVETIIQ
jgi:hypothetical protein